MEERLSRLYLQLLDAERRALEAAFEARAARRGQGSAEAAAQATSPLHSASAAPAEEERRGEEEERGGVGGREEAGGGAERGAERDSEENSWQQLGSAHLLIHEGANGSSRRGIRSPLAQRTADRRRAAGLLSSAVGALNGASPAAAPWRGSRYKAWLPGSAGYTATTSTRSRSSSSRGGALRHPPFK
jgi:hypothetical protein